MELNEWQACQLSSVNISTGNEGSEGNATTGHHWCHKIIVCHCEIKGLTGCFKKSMAGGGRK